MVRGHSLSTAPATIILPDFPAEMRCDELTVDVIVVYVYNHVIWVFNDISRYLSPIFRVKLLIGFYRSD